MSRTDAHRPSWVWMNDHPELVREHHDHTQGVCTLPQAPYGEHNDYGWQPGHRCWADLDPAVSTCGCRMCTWQTSRKAGHRRRRAAERTLLRAVVRGAAAQDLERFEADIDVLERTWSYVVSRPRIAGAG